MDGLSHFFWVGVWWMMDDARCVCGLRPGGAGVVSGTTRAGFGQVVFLNASMIGFGWMVGEADDVLYLAREDIGGGSTLNE